MCDFLDGEKLARGVIGSNFQQNLQKKMIFFIVFYSFLDGEKEQIGRKSLTLDGEIMQNHVHSKSLDREFGCFPIALTAIDAEGRKYGRGSVKCDLLVIICGQW